MTGNIVLFQSFLDTRCRDPRRHCLNISRRSWRKGKLLSDRRRHLCAWLFFRKSRAAFF